MSDQLQTLLQFLVTDASCIAHLSFILDYLSPSCLTPSPHLHKWATRVTSLMHSKDPAARWAAICIAYRMSFLSKSILVDNAQSWVAIVFPSLSKPEPVPILRVSVRYLTLVLRAAGQNLEFQRQVAIPIVPKVSSALLTIAEKHNDQDIKTLSIQTLVQLVPLYPSLHKALSPRLYALCNQIFTGSVHHTTGSLLDATVDLYAILHFLGGKVGGANLWRNCLDEVLQSSWSAWLALRTTFPTSAQLSHKAMSLLRPSDSKLPNPLLHADTTSGTPLTVVTLNLDRLKCGIDAIGALLRAPVNRPVKVPIGRLAGFCWCLLASTLDDEGQTHLDPHSRVAESAAVPHIWMHACRLLSCLAQTMQDLLAPHTSRLVMTISSHLEKKLEHSQRRAFLRCAYHLLYFCPVVGAPLAINRLLKATIVILSPLYLHQSRPEANSEAISQSRASIKRRREYDAESVLSAMNTTICTTIDECDTLIAALDVVNQCVLNTELAPSTRSLANRVILSILLSLASMSPSSLSPDPSFHERVIRKVREICVENAQGVSHVMSKGTGLVLHSFYSKHLATRDKLHSHVDLLLHPRRPPFVRTLPFVESLSLSSAEESAEESATRHSLDLAFADGETRLNASEPQNQPNPLSRNSLALSHQSQQALLDPPQAQILPTPAGPHPHTENDTGDNLPMEVATSSVLPVSPSQAMTEAPAELPLSVPQKGLVSGIHAAPMSVDESDHEEMPTIDLDTDSDT